MQQPFITITDAGVQIAASRPTNRPAAGDAYARRPVKVGVHHNLTLEIHCENFSTSTKLSVDDALGLVNRLAYAVREHVAFPSSASGQPK